MALGLRAVYKGRARLEVRSTSIYVQVHRAAGP